MFSSIPKETEVIYPHQLSPMEAFVQEAKHKDHFKALQCNCIHSQVKARFLGTSAWLVVCFQG